jgi:hypothetical protein
MAPTLGTQNPSFSLFARLSNNLTKIILAITPWRSRRIDRASLLAYIRFIKSLI